MEETDLLAIGGGFAGLVAANRAAQLGLRAIVLEAGTEPDYPCNSRISSGVFSVAFHSVQASAAEKRSAILRQTGGHGDPALIDALAEGSGAALDWLRAEGAKFVASAATSVTGQRNLLLAPPRRFREGLDWPGRGPDVLLRMLEAGLAKRGGCLVRGVRAERLILRDGACIGVACREGGIERQFAARAVVIADGGFQADPDLLREHIGPAPERLVLRAAPTGRGDGLRMARDAGAALVDLGPFYGHLQHRDAMTNQRLWPYPTLDALAAAALVVDAAGRRFADEGKGGIYLANAVARLDDPLSTWLVFDEAIWNGAGKIPPVAANPYLASAGGSMLRARDVAGLAAEAGLPADALAATVSSYNAATADGTLDRLAPPRTTGRYRADPIATPPFYAVPLATGITNTMGGIAIDADARVLRPGGAPIPGLYAAGATTGGVEGGPEAGYVGGLTKAFVWGLRAAEHAARWVR